MLINFYKNNSKKQSKIQRTNSLIQLMHQFSLLELKNFRLIHSLVHNIIVIHNNKMLLPKVINQTLLHQLHQKFNHRRLIVKKVVLNN